MRRIWTVLFIAVSTFWAIRGGLLLGQVRAEKAEPCELEAMSEDKITDEIYTAAARLEGVTAATEVWTLAKTVGIEDYTCDLMVCGMDSAYLAGTWLTGDVYPDRSDMLCAVINRSAAEGFRNEHSSKLTVVTADNWLSKVCHLVDDRSTPVRICGVIDDGVSEARAYVSISQIRSLLMDLKLESPCNTLWIRLVDVSFREDVLSRLSKLGLSAMYDDTAEIRWEIAEEKYHAHLSAAAFLMLAAVVTWWYDEKERTGIALRTRISTALTLIIAGIAAGTAAEIMW